jgi:cytochrome oxidase Cu insertion factor (SCO1/SenC/PrrC family)
MRIGLGALVRVYARAMPRRTGSNPIGRIFRAVAFVAVAATLAVGDGRGAASRPPNGTSPAAQRSPSEVRAQLITDMRSMGVHCIECLLLWDSNSGVLPPTSAAVKPPAAATSVTSSTADTWGSVGLATSSGPVVRLSDYAGRPMIIELMATWCASCAAQQDSIRDALSALPPDTVVVSLSVDPHDELGQLAAYATDRGYGWVFAAIPVELARSLRDAFGDLVLNPAASPLVMVDRSGRASLAPFGHKDVAALISLVPAG